MSLMLLQPGVNRTACLLNVDLAAFIRDTAYSQCPQSQVGLDQPTETRYLPTREAQGLDVVPTYHSANADEYRPDIRQKGD
jgi:hypothetical protein